MIWVEKYLRDHLVPSPSFDCALRKKKCKWLHGALKKDETGTKRKKKTLNEVAARFGISGKSRT